MHIWRRALAVVLLMVFLPASVLAAVPLTVCFGADGHRAIESAFSGHHHDTAAHSVAHAGDTTASLQLPNCFDLELKIVGASSPRQTCESSRSWSLDKLPAVVLPANEADFPRPIFQRTIVTWSSAAVSGDAFLVAHATDVLLN